MTDTKTVTHRLKPGSWVYQEYGPLEGTAEPSDGIMFVFQTSQGHAFDVYREEIEEAQ